MAKKPFPFKVCEQCCGGGNDLTKVSQLENDKGYTTMPEVVKKINESSTEIYIGSGDMPDGAHIQIDPNGDTLTIEDIVNSVLAELPEAEGASF